MCAKMWGLNQHAASLSGGTEHPCLPGGLSQRPTSLEKSLKGEQEGSGGFALCIALGWAPFGLSSQYAEFTEEEGGAQRSWHSQGC